MIALYVVASLPVGRPPKSKPMSLRPTLMCTCPTTGDGSEDKTHHYPAPPARMQKTSDEKHGAESCFMSNLGRNSSFTARNKAWHVTPP